MEKTNYRRFKQTAEKIEERLVDKKFVVPVPVAAPAPGYHHAIIGILLKAAHNP